MELQITNLLRILFEALFIGFGIIIPIISLIKTSNLKTLLVKDLFILQAVQSVRVAGIMNILLLIPDVYRVYFEHPASPAAGIAYVTYPASYQLWLFYPPVAYLLLTQLFWFKKIYMKKAALIPIALLLLILPAQWMITLLANLTSEHHDYLPSSWSITWANALPGSLIARIALSVVIFFFTTFSFMVASGKLKQFTDKK